MVSFEYLLKINFIFIKYCKLIDYSIIHKNVFFILIVHSYCSDQQLLSIKLYYCYISYRRENILSGEGRKIIYLFIFYLII